MAELKQLSPDILIHIAQTTGIELKALLATIELLDHGGSVPFIARYRKEVTGNLDEVQIRAAEEKLSYFRELEDRRETILRTIEEQGNSHRSFGRKLTRPSTRMSWRTCTFRINPNAVQRRR